MSGTSAIERIKNLSVGLLAFGVAIGLVTVAGIAFDYGYSITSPEYTAFSVPLYFYPIVGLTVLMLVCIFSLMAYLLFRGIENIGSGIRGEHQ